MVYEREFGYLSGELVELSCWRSSLVLDSRGVTRCPFAGCDTMSRCFPFPPPGYEPRLRSEHKDPLKKEKHKGKKHRKKKDSEEGERKEKDRDRRNNKHNKRLKREKRRERRKNKGGDEHNNQTLEEETQKNDDFDNRRPVESGRNEAVKDIKPTDELVSQLPGQKGHAIHKGSTSELLPRSTEGFGATGSQEKGSSLSRMVKKSGQETQHNHVMVQKNDSIVYTNKKGVDSGVDYKTGIKNRKSLQVGSAGKHSSRRHSSKRMDLPQDHSYTKRSYEGVHVTGTVVSGAGTGRNGRITQSTNTLQRAEEVGQHPEISVHSAYGKGYKISTKGIMGKENQSSNHCHSNMDQQFVRGKDGAVEGEAESKEVQTNYGKGVKGKDRDQNVSKRNTKNSYRVKEVEKKGNINEQNKVDDLMRLACLNEQKFASDDIKKRKDLDANSSLHEHSMRTTKLPRTSPTNLTLVNRKISPHSQGITPYSSTELVGADTGEVDWHKPQDGYSNEIAGSRYLEEHKVSVSSSGYDGNKGYLKPPHPDTKYLSQLYSIPATENIPESIDQDWLFSENRAERKTGTSQAAEAGEVWSDAQLIDTADVVALPYVFPL